LVSLLTPWHRRRVGGLGSRGSTQGPKPCRRPRAVARGSANRRPAGAEDRDAKLTETSQPAVTVDL